MKKNHAISKAARIREIWPYFNLSCTITLWSDFSMVYRSEMNDSSAYTHMQIHCWWGGELWQNIVSSLVNRCLLSKKRGSWGALVDKSGKNFSMGAKYFLLGTKSFLSEKTPFSEEFGVKGSKSYQSCLHVKMMAKSTCILYLHSP